MFNWCRAGTDQPTLRIVVNEDERSKYGHVTELSNHKSPQLVSLVSHMSIIELMSSHDYKSRHRSRNKITRFVCCLWRLSWALDQRDRPVAGSNEAERYCDRERAV